MLKHRVGIEEIFQTSIQCLPSMHEAMVQSPVPGKKERKKGFLEVKKRGKKSYKIYRQQIKGRKVYKKNIE